MESGRRNNLIRSVSRAIRVLRAFQKHGALTASEVSQIVNLPYPTAYRLISTLLAEGVVERDFMSKRYRKSEVHGL